MELSPSPSRLDKSSFTDAYVEELKLARMEQRITRDLEFDVIQLQAIDGTGNPCATIGRSE